MGEDVRIALCECLGEHYKLFPPKAAGTRRVTSGQSVQEPPSITNDDVATTRTLSSRWRRPGKSAAQVQAKVDIILPHNVRKVILIPLFFNFSGRNVGFSDGDILLEGEGEDNVRAAAEAAARRSSAKGGASRDAEEGSSEDYSQQSSPGESPPADSDDSRHSG